MAYEIGPAGAEDQADLTRLFLAYYQDLKRFGMNYTLNEEKLPEVIRARIRSRMFFFPVARDETGGIAGFLMASVRRVGSEYLVEGGPAVGYLHEMYIAPDHRRKGLASRLLEAMEDWLRAQNVAGVELNVLAGNPGARRLYEAGGFGPVASVYYKKL